MFAETFPASDATRRRPARRPRRTCIVRHNFMAGDKGKTRFCILCVRTAFMENHPVECNKEPAVKRAVAAPAPAPPDASFGPTRFDLGAR
ncbi:hypothetical protein EVAR_102185_1 [Eumeta japonica]|uniref:Uncharacterized protein n=1 Tax=Eumeta variegata TaxID=151549 RepID=A0A4C2AFF6_EUMVA|nr:hypothetical protein EVAR_102185_1 [Eumeta japonica]